MAAQLFVSVLQAGALSSEWDLRFEGVGRVYGGSAVTRLARSHVCVVGLGGVGSWAVEALARSGVGALTLVDLDEVCISNTNRQLHALSNTIGRSKASVLADRVRLINPECDVKLREEWLTSEGALALLLEEMEGEKASFAVLDAIDGFYEKAALIEASVRLGKHVVTVGAAGGKTDPCALRISDLALASNDPLLARTRQTLRKQYAFPTGAVRGRSSPWGVHAVYSIEPPPAQKRSDEPVRDCERFGTACFATGAFGFAAASALVTAIAQEQQPRHLKELAHWRRSREASSGTQAVEAPSTLGGSDKEQVADRVDEQEADAVLVHVTEQLAKEAVGQMAEQLAEQVVGQGLFSEDLAVGDDGSDVKSSEASAESLRADRPKTSRGRASSDRTRSAAPEMRLLGCTRGAVPAAAGMCADAAAASTAHGAGSSTGAASATPACASTSQDNHSEGNGVGVEAEPPAMEVAAAENARLLSTLFDSHCHATDGLEALRASGLRAVCMVSTGEDEWERVAAHARGNAHAAAQTLRVAEEGAQREMSVFGGVGVHPWFVHAQRPSWAARLEALLSTAPACIVGEIGLDRARLETPWPAQMDAFAEQIRIAARHQRPAVLHCVRAQGVLVDFLRAEPTLPPVLVMHAYGGSAETARELLKLKSRVYFGFTAGAAHLRRAPAAIAAVPADRLLVESDLHEAARAPAATLEDGGKRGSSVQLLGVVAT